MAFFALLSLDAPHTFLGWGCPGLLLLTHNHRNFTPLWPSRGSLLSHGDRMLLDNRAVRRGRNKRNLTGTRLDISKTDRHKRECSCQPWSWQTRLKINPSLGHTTCCGAADPTHPTDDQDLLSYLMRMGRIVFETLIQQYCLEGRRSPFSWFYPHTSTSGLHQGVP